MTADTKAGAGGLRLRAGSATALGARVLAITVLTVALAVPLAIWPGVTLLAVVVAGVLFLAVTRPAQGLLAGLGLFLCEGTVKVVLINTALPVDASPLAIGAAMIDLALFGAVIGVLARVPRAEVRAAAGAAGRPVLFAIGALAAWLLLSAVQVFTSPSLTDALESVRLTHAYLLLVPAGFVAFRSTETRDALVQVLLTILAAVMLYATVRGIIGPDPAEKAAAVGRDTVSFYSGRFRGVGTFSSAVGLASAAAPAAVFGVVLGALSRRHRAHALTMAVFALGAVVATYGRTPVLATLSALAFACVLIAGARLPRRRQLAVLGGMAGAIALLTIGAVLASTASPVLQDRLGGLVRPWSDRSMEMRYDTWKAELARLDEQPFGRGLGTVGRASGLYRGEKITTDSSYLKVLVEQGYPGLLLLVLALLSAIAVLSRRIARLRGTEWALGTAALAAFVAFAILMATGETIEHPGKVLVWVLLGLAIATLAPVGGTPAAPAPLIARLRTAARAESRGRRALWVAAGLVLTLTTLAITVPRQQHFTAAALVTPTRVPPFPARPDPHFLRQLFASQAIRSRLIETRTAGMQRPFGIEMRATADATGSVILVRSDDPDRSVRVVENVGGELRDASRRHLASLAADRLARLSFAISRSPGLADGHPARRALETSRARRLLEAPPAQIAIAPVERPAPTRRIDRTLDALPGPYPRRPNPVELGIAVPVAVLCAWLAALVLLPPRRAR